MSAEYDRVYTWYKTNAGILKQDEKISDPGYREHSSALIENLPAPNVASRAAQRAVMLEVLSGWLEWAHQRQNGNATNGARARHALDKSGGNLTPDEIEELQHESLWPFLRVAHRQQAISSAFGDSGPPPDPEISSTPQFRFSRHLEAWLRAALALARRSRRGGLTSSSLLFAMAEAPMDDAIAFVRDALIRTEGYERALSVFLSNRSDNPSSRAKDAGGWLGLVSGSVFALLEASRTVALNTAGSDEIHERHLVAALLSFSYKGKPTSAQIQMQRLGLDLNQLRKDFRLRLRSSAPESEQEAWDNILMQKAATTSLDQSGIAGEYLTGPSGYTSEFCGLGRSQHVPDHLGVDAYARRIAELIALRETKLPLAIGLFGNWGAGKSHFMNLIDQHLAALSRQSVPAMPIPTGAESAEQEDSNKTVWCREIVPIYFNAWHYLDTNLWASLVTEIFDALFKHLQPRADLLALMRSQLLMAGGATAQAENDVAQAKAEVERTATALEAARIRSEGARQAVEGLMDNLVSLLPRANVERNRRQIAEWLGVDAEVATLSELATKHKDLASLPGSIRELWRRMMAPEGRWWRLGWLVSSVVIVPILIALAIDWFPFLNALFGEKMRRGLTGLTTLIVSVIPFAVEVKRRIAQMTALQTEAERAQAARPKDQAVIRAQNDFAQAEADAKSAQAALNAARTTEQQLEARMAELQPERRLHHFIESRAQSADYRGQLGLVSLARRDFQELSNVFADAEALELKMRALGPEEAKTMAKLSASIDRIVLFVDDLDRCQPERVVDVLQAVHLLLAYPLFAVVVGVDQRCLRQSLRMQLKGLLTEDQIDSEVSSKFPNEDTEHPATPLDYLEKIFHVPFHLPSMGEEGYSNLIDKLTSGSVDDFAVRTTANTGSEEETEFVDDAAFSDFPVTNWPEGFEATQTTPPSKQFETHPNAEETPTRRVGSVPLQSWEVTALKEYHSLIRTPRAAKRLLNTYRLVRAGIPAEEWPEFCGDGRSRGEFLIAMLLLAAAAGYPAIAREWFAHFGAAPLAEFALTGRDEPATLRFKSVYDRTLRETETEITPLKLAKWIARVERFAF